MGQTVARNWIDGDWIDSGRHLNSINPATGETIGVYADGGREQMQAAITAAKTAFSASAWKRDRMLRAQVLTEMADVFERNAAEIVDLLASENGKTKGEAGFEVSMVAPKLRYFASLVRAQSGRAHQPSDGRYALVLREAIGVAGIIVPWNSPVVLLMRSLAPALAAGATAVAKMPAQTAQTNSLVAKLISTVASLPRGVVNIVTEAGDEGARLIVQSPEVPAISFTGSSHVGRAIAAAAGNQLKRVNLELGGKTPMLVFDDADLDRLIPTLEKSITVFAGQFCMTGSRILVQHGIAEEVRTRLAERLGSVKVGPASDASVDMGCLIDKASVANVERAVVEAIRQGAKPLVRGGPISTGKLAAGAFYRPALLEVSDVHMDIVQKETFGPVATLELFDTEARAVELANQTEFGLAASIWSRDVDRPWRIAQELDAGTVWINDWAVVYDECEEGGYKQSGLGRLNGMAALDAFTEYKHININAGSTSR